MKKKLVTPSGSGPFGEWLVYTLAKKKMTIEDLAPKLQVHPNTIRGWCKKPENLKYIRIIEIINILVDDPVLWRLNMEYVSRLITHSYDPNNKNINKYKNRRVPE